MRPLVLDNHADWFAPVASNAIVLTVVFSGAVAKPMLPVPAFNDNPSAMTSPTMLRAAVTLTLPEELLR